MFFGPDLLGVCNGSEVLVLSSKTGEVIRTFQGHSAEITSCKLCTANENCAISGSNDGKVICWNLHTGDVIYEFIIPEGKIYNAYELKTILPLSKKENTKQILLLVPDRVKSRHTSSKHSKNLENTGKEKILPQGYKLVIYDILRRENVRLLATYKYNTNPFVAIDNDFNNSQVEYIFVTKHNKISVWSGESKNACSVTCSETSPITALTVRGRGDIVVTGHKNGVVLVARGMDQWLRTAALPEKQQILPTFTVMHWHATAVSSVNLNATGTDVYSGGEEGVLVRWGLVGNDQGSKSFIPRLGAPVCSTCTSHQC